MDSIRRNAQPTTASRIEVSRPPDRERNGNRVRERKFVVRSVVMDVNSGLIQKRNEILRVAEKHGVLRVRVFGSVTRGDAGPDSDVDFLIEAGTRRSPFFPGGLVADLEDLLGRHVDVVEEEALHDLLRDQVLREAVPL